MKKYRIVKKQNGFGEWYVVEKHVWNWLHLWKEWKNVSWEPYLTYAKALQQVIHNLENDRKQSVPITKNVISYHPQNPQQ